MVYRRWSLTVESFYRNWDLIRKRADTWAGLRPIRVNVFGDVAVMHFYAYWRAETPDGVVTSEQKRTVVHQRRNGQWVNIGAQVTPVSAADAEPYK